MPSVNGGAERNKADANFGFVPGNGVHDIHMNRGNVGNFVSDDGVWQDGGLLFHFPVQQQWTAVFLKFQSQSWHTSDVDGAHGANGHVARWVWCALSPRWSIRSCYRRRSRVYLLNASESGCPAGRAGSWPTNRKPKCLEWHPRPGAVLRVDVQAPMVLSNKGALSPC